MKLNIKNIGEYLKSHDIKPSYQRMKIFEYLIEKRNHPTVDTVYQELVNEIPTLSKTTVYNTMNLFVEKKIAIIIVIEGNEVRYDADISVHGHFKCTKCEMVYDLEMDLSNIDMTTLKNFQINEHHIYFKGICNNCLKSNKES